MKEKIRRGLQKNLPHEKELFNKYYTQLAPNGKLLYLGKLLARAAHLFPDNTAIICKDVAYTFKELYERASQASAMLHAYGVKPGMRVALWIENSLEFYVAYWGILQTGAVVAPLNSFFTESEVRQVLRDAQAKACIISTTLAEKLKDVPAQELPPLISERELKVSEPVMKLDAPTIPDIPEDEMAVLLYTSGTTGVPKGVMLSSKNLIVNILQEFVRMNDLSCKDCIYAPLPLFHSFAQSTCVLGPCLIGASVIVVPRIERRWLLNGLRHNPTVIVAVPALYGLFCLMKTISFSKVQYFVSGGDALPDKIRASFELVYGRRICNAYGLTETSPLIAANMQDELLPTNTVGLPAVGVQCSLRDEDGNEVDSGDIGILWVKGDNIMLGYYNAPEATNAVLKDGWFNTGDFAQFDPYGRLIISGRHKDLIINKGIKIYPQEVENVILSNPGVVRVAVVGFPDGESNEVPIAFVASKAAPEKLEKELLALCRENLAPYKVPKKFILLEELPVTSLGKVDKKKLKADYEKSL